MIRKKIHKRHSAISEPNDQFFDSTTKSLNKLLKSVYNMQISENLKEIRSEKKMLSIFRILCCIFSEPNVSRTFCPFVGRVGFHINQKPHQKRLKRSYQTLAITFQLKQKTGDALLAQEKRAILCEYGFTANNGVTEILNVKSHIYRF